MSLNVKEIEGKALRLSPHQLSHPSQKIEFGSTARLETATVKSGVRIQNCLIVHANSCDARYHFSR